MTIQKLVIGIDYGTTNTGVAYALVTDTSEEHVDIEVIRKWPHGQLSRDASAKLPSEIAYNEAGIPVGYGFTIPADVQPLQWIKLFLDSEHLKQKCNAPNTDRLWRSYEELRRLDKSPVEVIADYLKWLWREIKENVERREEPNIFDRAEVTVVMTVPASWNDQAKDRLLQAAQKAKIESHGTVLKFRSEPEAAAILELAKHAKKGRIQNDDCVIVCDAGGGTVDVVSFQVVSTHRPLSLRQVAVSKGDFCGSAFVNSAFECQLRWILGNSYDKLGADAIDELWNDFEYRIKRKFNPATPSEHRIPVKGLDDEKNETREIANGKLVLDDAVLVASFESVMTQILSLIDDQKDQLKNKGLSDKLKGVVLVGGFGESDYLSGRIKQEHPEDEKVQVWRGDESWTAVVQGAVAAEVWSRTRKDTVETRLSSCNYGIPYREDSLRKVQWLVRKGQIFGPLAQTESYVLRMEEQEWLDEDEYAILLVQLVKTDDDLDSVSPPMVEYHVEIKCRVPTAIRNSPAATLVQNNPKVWHIPAELILAMEGPLLKVRCRIQNKDVGHVELKYYDSADRALLNDSAVSLLAPLQPTCEDEIRRDSSSISIVPIAPATSAEVIPTMSDYHPFPSPSKSKLHSVILSKLKRDRANDKKEPKERKPIELKPSDLPFKTGMHIIRNYSD